MSDSLIGTAGLTIWTSAPFPVGEGGAQDLVTRQDRTERLLQLTGGDHPVEAPAHGDIQGRIAG